MQDRPPSRTRQGWCFPPPLALSPLDIRLGSLTQGSFFLALALALALLLAPGLLLRAAAGQALMEVDGERVEGVLGGLGVEIAAALLREVAAAGLGPLLVPDLAVEYGVRSTDRRRPRERAAGLVGGAVKQRTWRGREPSCNIRLHHCVTPVGSSSLKS